MQLTKRFIYTLFTLLLLKGIALSGTAAISWQSNTEADLQGYNVYYGTEPRVYELPIPVGNTTKYTFDNLSEGQTYYFAVTSLDNSGNESGYSAEVNKTISAASDNPENELAITVQSPSNYTTDAITPNNTDDQYYVDKGYWFTDVPEAYVGLTHVKTAWADRANTSDAFLTFTISKAADVYVGYYQNATAVPSWLSSQFQPTGETIAGLYRTWNVWRKTFPAGSVVLGGNQAQGGNAAETYIVWIGEADATAPVADTTAPTIAITTPTAGSAYTTTSSVVDLAGTASDNEGLAQVTWSNSVLGSGTAMGTSSWSANGIPLQPGENTITVTAVDLSGNEAQSSLVVNSTPPDTAAPVVAITSPVDTDQYTTENDTIVLSGTAQDDQGLELVTWSSSAGSSGTADGTAAWTTPTINLVEGLNSITVTATDSAGNTSEDVIEVIYTAPDATAPTVSIASPSSSDSYTTAQNVIDLSGSAADNKGVSKVSWSSSSGQSGLAAGLGNWTIGNIDLQEGTNAITVTAEDAAGNTGNAILTVTYTPPDTSAPTVVITNPSDTLFETTENAIQIAGTTTDNQGVIQVSWSSNSGASGSAVGTTQWIVDAIALQTGTNTLTVTAVDAAGNTGTATLTVVYNPPDVTTPLIQIAVPTSAGSYTSNQASISLAGTASDNVGLAQVTWTSSTGDSGDASGTENWTKTGINLAKGETVITVTAIDSAGNYASDAMTVIYAAADTLAPTVEITSPTTKTSYFSRGSTLDVGGTASDNVAITKVVWMNSQGITGTCKGTTEWQAFGIPLNRFWNTITITAFDVAGNRTQKALKVFRWR